MHSGLASGHLRFWRLSQITFLPTSLKSTDSEVSENDLAFLFTQINTSAAPI